MDKLNITVKDMIGLITIVVGIVANYYIVANQVSNNEARLNELTRKIEHLEVKDGEQDLIQNTLIMTLNTLRSKRIRFIRSLCLTVLVVSASGQSMPTCPKRGYNIDSLRTELDSVCVKQQMILQVLKKDTL